ncbi:MAG: hypothetical protein MUC90_05940 [Thermoplasmata archaeon]|nr:hypothetical protein [Thermoplasmata archaeon]
MKYNGFVNGQRRADVTFRVIQRDQRITVAVPAYAAGSSFLHTRPRWAR